MVGAFMASSEGALIGPHPGLFSLPTGCDSPKKRRAAHNDRLVVALGSFARILFAHLLLPACTVRRGLLFFHTPLLPLPLSLPRASLD